MIITNRHHYHTKINHKTYFMTISMPFISLMFSLTLSLSQNQSYSCAEINFLRTVD